MDQIDQIQAHQRVRDGAAEPGARLFVWGGWGVMTLASSALVARYGTDVPTWDDYGLVLAMTGDQPITSGWLWEQWNEHRYPIPKLILVGAGRLAGNDVRAGMVASVTCLSALAAGMIALSGRLRGGMRPTDAVFPILLLHPGHAVNLLWCFMFAQILPTAIAGAVLVAIAASASWPGPRRAAGIGAALVLLPLCGGTGLLYVPALAAWLFAAAWVEGRSGRSGAALNGVAIALAAVPGLLLTALYLRGFRGSAHPPSPEGVLDNARAALQFLTGGLGAPAAWSWPWSGFATFGAIAAGLAMLYRGWRTKPGERSRVFGLAAFLAALLAMAAGVGWGRGWAGPLAGFQDRYVSMAAPLWCWLAIVFRLYATPALDLLAGHTLLVVACVLLWPNAEAGFANGRGVSATAFALARDVKAGLTPSQLVARYTPSLYPSQDELSRFIPILRRRRVGPFGGVRDEPPHHEVAIPVTPSSVSFARWDSSSSTAHVTGEDPQLLYRLPSPRPVVGVRIRYSHSNPQGSPGRFQLTWLHPGQSEYTPSQRYSFWTLPTGTHKQTTVWIGQVVSEFRIQPDNQPCDFRIDGITLLEPGAAPSSGGSR
jgi:hypothetical protein